MIVALKFISDLICIPIVFVTAYILKFKLNWFFSTVFEVRFDEIYSHAQIEPYLQGLGLIMLLWVITFYIVGLYKPFVGLMPEVDEFMGIVKGVTIVMIEVMAVIFVFKVIPDSRFVILYAWFLGIGLLSVSRFLISRIELVFLKKGVGIKNTLILGVGELGQDIAERIVQNPSYRLSYKGSLGEKVPDKMHFHLRERFNYLGQLTAYQSAYKKYNIDAIFLTDKNYESSFFDELVLFCENNKIELNVLSDLASFLSGTTTVENFDGVPFVVHKQLTQSTCALILKRFFDICLSGLGLVFLSPLFLIVSIVIKCVSPHGPVFYLQERVGLNGKAFKMIKLRTMYPDAESRTGPVLVDEKGDSRYIRGGGFLRRYSIDELPQLFNVIKGEMSLVGPRPERPFFVEKYTKTNPNFLLRHQIRGGLTGWAQINGRSVLTRRPEHKLKYDLYYIKRWSLVLDIKIMIKTVSVVLRKEESY